MFTASMPPTVYHAPVQYSYCAAASGRRVVISCRNGTRALPGAPIVIVIACALNLWLSRSKAALLIGLRNEGFLTTNMMIFQTPDIRLICMERRYMDKNSVAHSLILDPRSTFLDPRSTSLDHRSSILDQRSSILQLHQCSLISLSRHRGYWRSSSPETEAASAEAAPITLKLGAEEIRKQWTASTLF